MLTAAHMYQGHSRRAGWWASERHGKNPVYRSVGRRQSNNVNIVALRTASSNKKPTVFMVRVCKMVLPKIRKKSGRANLQFAD